MNVISRESGVAPIVSLIIATYNSGEDLDKLVASLDAQTLPQDQFEVVFVDDGSTNGTFERLQAFVATRPNYHVERIENSGWPSRPRNIGMKKARGEYVTFMDHDDALFPEGLKKLTEYARQTNADVVIPHEVKTNDMWMFLPSFDCGNVADIETVGGFQRMIPMVPHKLYRREMLISNDVSFPERRRALWEDQYINVGAYRYAKKIAVNAETPFYIWRATDSNTSFTFHPSREDFWTNLDQLLEFTSDSLSAPEHAPARTRALALHVRARITDRLVRLLSSEENDGKDFAMREARRLLLMYLDDDVLAAIPRRHQILATLLSSGQFDSMVDFQKFDLSHKVTPSLSVSETDSQGLHAVFSVLWNRPAGPTDVLVSNAKATEWNLPDSVGSKVPEPLRRLTPDDCDSNVRIAMMNRNTRVTWTPDQSRLTPEFLTDEAGSSVIRSQAEFVFNPQTSAFGSSIGRGVWDFYAQVELLGMIRNMRVPYVGPTLPVVWAGDFGVIYSNNSGGMTFDNSGVLRTFAIDSMGNAPLSVTKGSFEVELPNAQAFSDGEIDAGLYTERVLGDSYLDRLRARKVQITPFSARVVSRNGKVLLRGELKLRAGEYRVHADRGGKLVPTAKVLTVDRSGSATISKWE